MSQKIFCDLCGNPLKVNELSGGMMRHTETFPIIPGIGPQPTQMIQKRVMEEVWDLCQECQRFVWGLVEKKKEDLKRLRELTGKPL